MKRSLAGLVACGLALALSAGLAHAADSFPPSKDQTLASAQPRFAGYRLQEIRDWSPATDPYAEFLRAEVPLQKRIAPLAATQANPALDGKAEVMLMQGDYGNAFFNTAVQNNDFAEHTLNFWQYADYYSPWHGAATASTPQGLYDPKTSDWRNRGFEFGIVNIPNPAYTNAAHRNGVKSIATIYFDPAFRPGLTFAESFEKDPNGAGYIIAEKLLEMAKYYGFDGYFLNQEEGGDDSQFKPFMSYLTSKGLYTQWYDTNSTFDESKMAWLKDAKHGQIHDSVFVNYGWPSYLPSALDYAAKQKVNPHRELFFGVEANQAKFSGAHPSASSLSQLYAPGTKNPRGGIALFTPSDYYQRGLDDDVKLPDLAKDRPLMQQNDFQWMIAERERMYFSGVLSDPRRTGKQPGYARPDVGVKNADGWVGVADFSPARSVISGAAFASSFNTGHGMQWFQDGAVTRAEQWANINVQSVLPSWQWWIDTAGTRPQVDFDYGKAMARKSTTGAKLPSPFAPQGAWKGGSSLVIHGDLSAPTTLRLFKTDLAVSSSSKLTITFKKTSGDDAGMRAGLIFADAPKQLVTMEIPQSKKAGGWHTATIDLSKYAGKKLATIGLQFEAASKYQMNIGEVTVTDGRQAPAAPTEVVIKRVFDDGQLELGWKKAAFAEVDGYLVEAVHPDGRTEYLTGGYTDLGYVKKVSDTAGNVRFTVRAIGKDGRLSKPATASFDYSAQPRKLAVAEAKSPSKLLTQAATPGVVKATWEARGAASKNCQVDVRLVGVAEGNIDDQPYQVKVPCADGAAQVPVPVTEGYSYDLTVTPDGAPQGMTYRGRTHDGVAEPLPASGLRVEAGALWLRTPAPKDWWKLSVDFVDTAKAVTPIGKFTRGDRSSEGMQSPKRLPAAKGTVLTTLTDYAGNTVKQRFEVRDGKLVADTKAPEVTVNGELTQTVIKGEAIRPVRFTATDGSAVTLQISKLPDGLTWRNAMPTARAANADTSSTAGGELAGKPLVVGEHVVTLTATDAYGNHESRQVKITVKPSPEPTSTPTATPTGQPTSTPTATLPLRPPNRLPNTGR